jgi:hypothetical protein
MNYTKRRERELTSYDRAILCENLMDGISPGDTVLAEIQSPNYNNLDVHLKETKECVAIKSECIDINMLDTMLE